MDKQTAEYLRKLRPDSQTIKSMYKKERPFEQEKAKLEDALKSRHVSKRDKEVIKRTLESNGALYEKETLVMNESVAKAESKRMEQKVKDAIRRGDLKPHDFSKDKQGIEWLRKTQGL